VNRVLPSFAAILIHQVSKSSVARLIDQNESRQTVHRNTAADEKKIAQVRAKQQHAFAFGECFIEMFAADNWNVRLDFGVGRFHRDADLHTSAQKVSQRLARNGVDLSRTKAIA
jgi:hypothetical protein